MTEHRRLAAIVSADIVGYSRLMGRDDSGTLASLKALRRDVVDPRIAAHNGRIVKTTGDGLLLEFASVVDAVRCMIEVQTAMTEKNADVPEDRRIAFRTGINVGDIIIDGDDIFGDGVNVAARLQEIAAPGGVCVSSRVNDDIRNRLDTTFEDAGTQTLKNIARPVQVWRWSPDSPAATSSVARPADVPLALPDKPSIAVLPFSNMSGDPEQEYFADGIAEDVITTLSKIEQLMVIARNSSFVFKGQSRDIREIGRILGVRYVLEGGVRKSGNRVRLTAQLIDSLDGSHMWADRFDGDLNDVFELQDRITQDIVAALEVRLTFGEETRVWRKRSGSPLVYEHFLRGRTLYINFAQHSHAQARSEFEQAVSINPAYAPAIGMLALTLTDQARFGWDQATTYELALECAAQALAVDPNSDVAYLAVGYTRLFQRRHDEAVTAGEKAIVLGPNSAGAYHMAGMYHGYAGDFRKAALYEEQSQRLSPLSRNESRVDEARARFHLGDFIMARDNAFRVLVERPRWLTAQTILVAALWNLGNKDESRLIAKKMLTSHPNLTASRWARGLPYRHQKDLDALVTPLRLAGLPE